MKKSILFIFAFFVLAQIHAQTKITKTNIIGKWSVLAVDMPGMIYYNLEKDSLAIGETLKSQMPDPSQLSTVTSMIKPQMAVFAKIGFQFNTDGTVILESGNEGSQSGTFTVDEEKSEITTTEKDQKQTVFKADFIKENLRVNVKQPQGEMTLILKKAKS